MANHLMLRLGVFRTAIVSNSPFLSFPSTSIQDAIGIKRENLNLRVKKLFQARIVSKIQYFRDGK